MSGDDLAMPAVLPEDFVPSGAVSTNRAAGIAA